MPGVAYAIKMWLHNISGHPVFRLIGGKGPGEGYVQMYGENSFIIVRELDNPAVLCSHLYNR